MKHSHYLRDVVELFYPRICPGCINPLQQKEKLICIFCLAGLPKTNIHKPIENPVGELFKGRIELFQANSWLYFRKKGIVQSLMHQLKYKGNSELGKYLGSLYARDLMQIKEIVMPEVVTCVPMHPQKQKIRGFNQSEVIAQGFAEELGLKLESKILIRKHNSLSQTKKKRFDRWENTYDSYSINPLIRDIPHRIAVIDDVITTGATLEACAGVLKNSGCLNVSVFSLCFAIN